MSCDTCEIQLSGRGGSCNIRHASMTKLGLFTSCHFNTYREKNAPKFRNEIFV